MLIATDTGAQYDWTYDLGTWRKTACRLSGRDLDRDEWRDAFGSRP